MPTTAEVKSIFEALEQGDRIKFFSNVADDVNWTVKGTYCKVSGHYKSAEEFHNGTATLSSTWATPLKLVVQDIIASGNRAVVELKAVDVVCKNGLAFTNEYAWVLKFNDQNKIIEVNAYMDTDLVTRAIEQNPS